jgi:SAM-dependent methyltransferase
MIGDSEVWLGRIAGAPDIEARARAYDAWAATYDEDVLRIGYTNHAVAAALVGRHVPVAGACLLDAGVGTGALGPVLAALGYGDVTGIDMSDGMLAKARLRGTYRDLRRRMLGEPLDFGDASFTAVVSFGVFAMGHAPPAALDELVRVTRPGGFLVFSVGASPWENGGFKEKAGAFEAAGVWTEVDVTAPYRPMPLSTSRGDNTNRAFVYRRA